MKTPSWDLKDLFSSIEDPKIEQLISSAKVRAEKFREKYCGKMTYNLEPENLLISINEYETILSMMVLPQAYGEMIFTVNSIPPANGAFLQKVRKEATEIYAQLIFYSFITSKRF